MVRPGGDVPSPYALMFNCRSTSAMTSLFPTAIDMCDLEQRAPMMSVHRHKAGLANVDHAFPSRRGSRVIFQYWVSCGRASVLV
jgi:hypothetical protein